MVPDARALGNILSLWNRWIEGQPLGRGFTLWRDVFSRLRDIRPWGPSDRVAPEDASLLREISSGRSPDEPVRIEVELVYRHSVNDARAQETELLQSILSLGGEVIHTSRIPEIAYHAILADLPAQAVWQIAERSPNSLAGSDPVSAIRPQSLASDLEVGDLDESGAPPAAATPTGDPIAALIDGVPQQAHPLLFGRLIVDDPNDLEGQSVGPRVHGTAMASLIVHGDLNELPAPLPRPIYTRPVMFAPAAGSERFPDDRLVIDVFYEAIRRMKEGAEATAPTVIIANVSLGDTRRRFSGRLSPWARALDRLAYKYGILFIVSAGNATEALEVRSFSSSTAFESASTGERAKALIQAAGAVMVNRRLFAPADAVNALTVGALHKDAITPRPPAQQVWSFDPFPDFETSAISSALGPGFASATKPEILLPGGRQRVRLLPSSSCPMVRVEGPNRLAGLRVAAPPSSAGAPPDATFFTSGTSAAAALATRTAHRTHDALESAYPDFLSLAPEARALVLKALLVHQARWTDAASIIIDVLGPADGRLHVRQKDNVRRFLGFGAVEPEDTLACAADRATAWATGRLGPDGAAVFSMPVPAAIAGQARPHSVCATLAWFTPPAPGRQAYRTVRLSVVGLSNDIQADLGLTDKGGQPDDNQARKGTVVHRWWRGQRAASLIHGDRLSIQVQRDPDQGGQIDEEVPFAVAVTIAMPGEVRIYDQVRTRLSIQPQVPVLV